MLAAALALAAPAAAHPRTAHQAASHWRALTWHYQRLSGYPLTRLGRAPLCHAACRWHRATRWHHRAHHAHRVVERLRHPSSLACYRLVARRFAPYGWEDDAAYIVTRESRCRWYAENARSTAAGVWQFLDHWGTLEQRLDAVWSTARAVRAWRVQGGPCPAWCAA